MHSYEWMPEQSGCLISYTLARINFSRIADDLETQGARASATMILNMLRRNNSFPAH